MSYHEVEFSPNNYQGEKFNCPFPHKTKISANFTANYLIGREHKQLLLKKNMVRTDSDDVGIESTIADLTTFFNDGGEGIDLTFEEACMLHAIAKIFTKYDYPNEIECSKGQIFEAMGCGGNLSGHQRQRLRKVLENLADKKFPIYWSEKDRDGGRYKWLTYDSLIKLAWGVDEDSGKDSHLSPSRSNFSHYKLAFNRMFIGPWKDGFRLAESNIGNEIRIYKKARGGRPSKYDLRFYYLLIGENKEIVKRNYLKIAKNPMLMDHLIKQRKCRFIREKLDSIYEMYKELGYLLSYEINKKGAKDWVDVFYLNPEKFYRLRKTNTAKR